MHGNIKLFENKEPMNVESTPQERLEDIFADN